jgi:hypothetical protein
MGQQGYVFGLKARLPTAAAAGALMSPVKSACIVISTGSFESRYPAFVWEVPDRCIHWRGER